MQTNKLLPFFSKLRANKLAHGTEPVDSLYWRVTAVNTGSVVLAYDNEEDPITGEHFKHIGVLVGFSYNGESFKYEVMLPESGYTLTYDNADVVPPRCLPSVLVKRGPKFDPELFKLEGVKYEDDNVFLSLRDFDNNCHRVPAEQCNVITDDILFGCDVPSDTDYEPHGA